MTDASGSTGDGSGAPEASKRSAEIDAAECESSTKKSRTESLPGSLMSERKGDPDVPRPHFDWNCIAVTHDGPLPLLGLYLMSTRLYPARDCQTSKINAETMHYGHEMLERFCSRHLEHTSPEPTYAEIPGRQVSGVIDHPATVVGYYNQHEPDQRPVDGPDKRVVAGDWLVGVNGEFR